MNLPKGVIWNEELGKWHVTLFRNGREYYIGRFDDLDEAKRAREAAEKRQVVDPFDREQMTWRQRAEESRARIIGAYAPGRPRT